MVILHGTLGSPEGNWFRWLEHELLDRGLEVWLPALPNAEEPSLSWWARFVWENCPFELDKDTLLIGHSSGATLALVLAQQASVPIGGIIAVSVLCDNSSRWAPNNKLFDMPFEWGAIRAHSGPIVCLHSDNDPYVALSKAQFVVEQCAAELILMAGQGHFNLEQSPDYIQFPELLNIIHEHFLV